MMIIKTMSGEKIKITDEEFQNLGNAKVDLIHFKSSNCTINRKYIATIYPEDLSNDVEKRRDQQTGVLHDGRKVRKHFGQWVLATGEVLDERGSYVPIKIDPEYFPEVVKDCVFTEEEYEKIKHLSTLEKKELITSRGNNLNLDSGVRELLN